VKKKILIIVENAPVPFDTRVMKEAVSLHEAGYEVTVLCPRMKMLSGIRDDRRHPCLSAPYARGREQRLRVPVGI
jgi:hypothetical protein